MTQAARIWVTVRRCKLPPSTADAKDGTRRHVGRGDRQAEPGRSDHKYRGS